MRFAQIPESLRRAQTSRFKNFKNIWFFRCASSSFKGHSGVTFERLYGTHHVGGNSPEIDTPNRSRLLVAPAVAGSNAEVCAKRKLENDCEAFVARHCGVLTTRHDRDVICGKSKFENCFLFQMAFNAFVRLSRRRRFLCRSFPTAA